MTPSVNEYINASIKYHPSLYAGRGTSRVQAEMKVMNQLLNVIGNGIRDNHELAEHLGPHESFSDSDVKKYLVDDIYVGYEKVKIWGEGTDHEWTFPDGDSLCYVPDRERDQWPTVKYWMKSSVYPFNPYPNFDEKYSTIYQCPDYLKLGDDWIEKAIEFYIYCRQWIVDNEGDYHGAYPCTEDTDSKKRIEDFKRFADKYETYEEITEAYGKHSGDYRCEFTGDWDDFLRKLWARNKADIMEFIDGTLVLLYSELENRK